MSSDIWYAKLQIMSSQAVYLFFHLSRLYGEGRLAEPWVRQYQWVAPSLAEPPSPYRRLNHFSFVLFLLSLRIMYLQILPFAACVSVVFSWDIAPQSRHWKRCTFPPLGVQTVPILTRFLLLHLLHFIGSILSIVIVSLNKTRVLLRYHYEAVEVVSISLSLRTLWTCFGPLLLAACFQPRWFSCSCLAMLFSPDRFGSNPVFHVKTVWAPIIFPNLIRDQSDFIFVVHFPLLN